MGIIMIPLLIILNYIIIDRFHYLLKESNHPRNIITSEINSSGKSKRPVIEFEGKKYIFSIRSILILAIGAPVLSYAIYLFFDIEFNYWLHEIVVKQTVFFLNLLFNMQAESLYVPVGTHHWSFIIPNRGQIYFQTFCTGVQAICVFAGIIICIPHSLDSNTNKDILWRKTKALIMSSVIFYVVNIIRMLIQIYLFYIGYAWEDIHYSISAASSFIAAIIILLLHKWIPEFIISIIYTGNLVGKKYKEHKGQKNDQDINKSNSRI
jgi:exosortase/archaeosortase family protein